MAAGNSDREAPRAVLIDIDGTLIDSNEAHARAWADILQRRGWPEITWQQVLPLVGMGGDKLLPELTGVDAGGNSKPDPDIVIAALEKAGVAPGEAIMLGDTPYDVEAARKAGVRTIAVRSGGWGDDKLRDAVAIYADAAELNDRFDDSPLGNG